MFKKDPEKGTPSEGVYRPNVSERGGPTITSAAVTALIEKEETPDLNEVRTR
jgi:hypothetical protein